MLAHLKTKYICSGYFFLLITENIKSQDHHICVLYLFSRLGGVDQGFSASWESMLWEFWVLSREKPKIYSFSRFLHISPCWWLIVICLVRDKVSGRRVICVLVTWRKPEVSCREPARGGRISCIHWSRRSRGAACFFCIPFNRSRRVWKNPVFFFFIFQHFSWWVNITWQRGFQSCTFLSFFQTEKCCYSREMGIGKDDHVVLEQKSFIDFELGDSAKDEANEEESSLTEKKQIIDAIGSKDTVVLCTPVGNWFGSESRSTSSIREISNSPPPQVCR